MHRTNLYIDDDLRDELRQVAALEGRPAAALVRDAVRAYLRERRESPPPDPFKELIGAFASGRSDGAANHDRYLYGDDLNAERAG